MKIAVFLKYIRRFVAVLVGGMLLLLFLDFTRLVPQSFHVLAHLQLIPAIMNGMIGILVLLLLATLLFGRVYCSVLCPLGILQDAIYRFKKWFYTARKQKKKLRTAYMKPQNILRYSLLGVLALGFVTGWTALVLWLDPYSNFGRIVTAAFKPVAAWINNLISSLLGQFGIYSVYHVEILYLNHFLAIFGIGLLILLVALVWRRERIWCNTVCPVGTLLGVVSRYSLFRVRINESLCNHCKNCTSNCKSRCIDDTHFRVDNSRCVTCFNCLDKCKKGAIGYTFAYCKTPKTAPLHEIAPQKNVRTPTEKGNPANEHHLNPVQLSRRRFVQGSAITLAATALPLASLARAEEPSYEKRSRYPLPPGAVKNFHQKCTGCQLCVTQCPMQVLRPAFLEHGILSMMQPLLYFHPHCYCNYDCTVCGDVCPNGAILPLTVEKKRLTQMGEVHFIEDECIVKTENQDCGACAEHCPTQAVHMVPYESNGLTIPSIDPSICVGCGACESICPVRPLAIFIEGHREQILIDPALMWGTEETPTYEGEAQEVEVQDPFAGLGEEVRVEESTAPGTASATEAADTVKTEAPQEFDFGF